MATTWLAHTTPQQAAEHQNVFSTKHKAQLNLKLNSPAVIPDATLNLAPSPVLNLNLKLGGSVAGHSSGVEIVFSSVLIYNRLYFCSFFHFLSN